jgi:hypothetical protein
MRTGATVVITADNGFDDLASITRVAPADFDHRRSALEA